MANPYQLPYLNYSGPASSATSFGGVNDWANALGGNAALPDIIAKSAGATQGATADVGLTPSGSTAGSASVAPSGGVAIQDHPGMTLFNGTWQPINGNRFFWEGQDVTGGGNAGNILGPELPLTTKAGTPAVGSMEWMQANVNRNESTPDFWSELEKSNPAMFASIMETTRRGANIPTGGIGVTGPNLSGSSPQRVLSADFGEGAFFGADNTPSSMIDPALKAFEAAFGHNPWDIDPATGKQYAFPGA